MESFSGKVAVITGAASGIGAATARLFVQSGAQVIIADVQDERGQLLAEELGSTARYIHCDVSREAQVQALVAQTLAGLGRLDCLFNNAGIPGVGGPIEDTPVEGFDQIMAIHLRGVFLGMKHAAPVMKRQGSGSIINTGSVAGLRAGYSDHIYSAAKAAIIHLTRCVAMELGESGVRVNSISPGGIATPIFGKAFGLTVEEADRTVPLLEAALGGGLPIRRSGHPEDIARTVLWLASDESSFVTGHDLVVDGGLIGGRGWSEAQASWDRLAALLDSVRAPHG